MFVFFSKNFNFSIEPGGNLWSSSCRSFSKHRPSSFRQRRRKARREVEEAGIEISISSSRAFNRKVRNSFCKHLRKSSEWTLLLNRISFFYFFFYEVEVLSKLNFDLLNITWLIMLSLFSKLLLRKKATFLREKDFAAVFQCSKWF